jgi:RimJ/RimL family protein N-acetyltransferase
MNECDVIIISSGIIIYEALSLKKLIFTKYIAQNQKNNFKFLTKNKYVEKINDLKNLNKKILYFNTSKSKNFFKNYSVIEIFKTIFFGIRNKNNYHLSLLNYEAEDIKDIYDLQTPENREFFKDNKVFSYSHHIKYLSKFHKLENNFILMIKKDLFETVGYIKFQEHMKKMFISIIIKKSYQQQGIGKQVLKILNLNKFSNKKFYAEVKKKNLKSINAFSKAGFIKNKNLKII